MKHHSTVLFFSVFFLGYFLVSGCRRTSTEPDGSSRRAILGVISDIHYFDPGLGVSGAAFDAGVLQDRKMIAESEALLEAVIHGLMASGIEILLVPGDLTKDGERASHEKVAEYFAGMEEAGVDVYVVPGNHDVANPNAMSYAGDAAVPVPSVTPEEFATVYGDCGYGQAIERDGNSLSYLAEIGEDLWLLAIDACRYGENTDHPITGGRFSPSTWTWIEEKIREAEDRGKRVLGMMHHGILEHFVGQTQIFADYVVDDYISKSMVLADLGLRVMFTGHFHSQDIVKLTRPNGFIFDIETGSPVTYPCPYRIIELADRTMSITSFRIETIDYDTEGLPFSEYARRAMEDAAEELITDVLSNDYGMPVADAEAAVPLLVEVILAHYQGDESPSDEIRAAIDQLLANPAAVSRLLGNVLRALWTDLHPADNVIVIDLETGAVTDAHGS